MADFHTMITIDDLKTTFLKEQTSLDVHMSYEPLADTLKLQFVSPEQETVVLTFDDYVGWLYMPDSLEVVGVFIEDVKYGFLALHPDLKRVWDAWESSQKQQRDSNKMLSLELTKAVMKAITGDYSDSVPELVAAFA